jgi:hypothetical protein
MKVKCINIFNQHTKEFKQSSYWLTIGREYIVLEVNIFTEKKVLYRLVGDNPNESPGLYCSSQFEIISGKIPSNWLVSQINNNVINLSPASWSHLGFWEDCFDLEPEALEVYKKEARIIAREENE